jgi:pimeloyl-ACP methyl ester carboxylesterase
MAWAELSDVQCYYEIRGAGEPLLLIPGLGGICRMWDPVAAELERYFSVILFDNRGMGQSLAKRPAHNLKHLAADVVELLDHLQIDRAHVLGLSLGGIIAQRLAMEHASRVDRLVLISCTDNFSPYLRQITLLLAHALRQFSTETFIRTVELLGTAPEFLDAHEKDIERQIALKTACGFSKRSLADQLRCLAGSDHEPCDPITAIPTLVLAGEHDALIPNCYARRMADRIPGSEFHIIDGAGHNPFYECPRRVLPLITNFLSRGHGRGTPFAAEYLAEPAMITTGGNGSF